MASPLVEVFKQRSSTKIWSWALGVQCLPQRGVQEGGVGDSFPFSVNLVVLTE